MRALRRAAVVSIALASLIVIALAGTASAAYKPFALQITTLAPTYSNSAGLTGSGRQVTITARFTNENTTQQLGSADLGLPSALTPVSATIPPPDAAKVATCNSVITGPCVQVRNLSLAPFQSVTVTITVNTSACASGPETWNVEAKQANNFSGTPGNDLTLDTANSNIVTQLDGACKLAFVTEPHSALINQVISGTDWTPTGNPVTVQVVDSHGNAVSASTASIAMTFGNNAGGAMLGGTTTEAADGSTGTASFGDLTINLAANGYVLAASSGTLGVAGSSSFNIQDQSATCSGSGGSCKTDVGVSGNHASVLATATGTGGLLLESVNANSGAQLVCKGYTSADPNTYESLTTFDASKVITTTITTPAIQLNGNANQILKGQQICFGAPYDFTTASGSLAPAGSLPDGTPGFIGLLPTCTGSTTGPCHNRQQDSTPLDPSSPLGFDIVLVADVPAGLPGDPFHH